jgi:hypothetical protein
VKYAIILKVLLVYRGLYKVLKRSFFLVPFSFLRSINTHLLLLIEYYKINTEGRKTLPQNER